MASAQLSFVATQGALDVYVGEDDQWVVQKGPQVCDTNQLRARASLLWLPLLEQEYPTFSQQMLIGLSLVGPELAERRWAAFPMQELLLLVFTTGCSGYWVNLALAWAADVGLGPEVKRQVRALALDPSTPQSIRHRAKRLYYTGNSYP